MVVADTAATRELVRAERLRTGLAVRQQHRHPPHTARRQRDDQGIEQRPVDTLASRTGQHPDAQDPRVIVLQVGDDRARERAVGLGDSATWSAPRALTTSASGKTGGWDFAVASVHTSTAASRSRCSNGRTWVAGGAERAELTRPRP